VASAALARWSPAALALALVLGPGPAGAEETPPALYHLAGSIDPGVVLQAELQMGKEAITGTLVRSGSDRPSPLEGTVLADGHVELYVRGDFGRLVGTVRGTLRQEGPSRDGVITGEWRDGDALNPRPLRLEEVARYVTVSARRGDDLEISCQYPFLLGRSPAVAEVNGMVGREAMTWLQQALSEEPSGASTPRAVRYEDTLVHDSPRLVSRLVRIVTESATPPPDVTYRAENLEMLDGRVKPLRLGELFRVGSPYWQTLSTRALEELRRAVAPDQVSGQPASLREGDLDGFTVSPAALQLVIPAVRAGRPGPGHVLVSIPLGSVAGLLDPHGPLG
jgi:hypothetical protein